MATQSANLESSFLEKIGEKFTSLTEGVVGAITRLIGGSSSERVTKSLGYYRPKHAETHTVTAGSVLARTNALEDEMKALSDDELRGLSDKYRQRLKRSTTCSRKRSPRAARPPAATRGCATTTCRSSAGPCSTATRPASGPSPR
jgi:hypothetical protein